MPSPNVRMAFVLGQECASQRGIALNSSPHFWFHRQWKRGAQPLRGCYRTASNNHDNVEMKFTDLSQTAAPELPLDALAGMPMQAPSWAGISTEWYENEIPDFSEETMERLYGNLFSSMAHFRVRGGADNASTFVARRGSEIISLLLFRRRRGKLNVLNEGMRLDSEEARCFADYAFDRYKSVNVIQFHAVDPGELDLPYPTQRFNCLEDIVLDAPPTPETYLASLGKSTRSYLNRYRRKLQRDFPSFRHEVVDGKAVDERQVREIVQLNRTRMNAKGRESIIDDRETRQIIRMVRECGSVGIVTIDGRLCAGAINYRCGDNYFLDVIAHDPAYNDYRLGTLCCYLTISEYIARGCQQYHFLWGQYDYKYRLGGVRRDLADVIIYRSGAQMLLNGQISLQHMTRAGIRGTRIAVQRILQGSGPLARLAQWLAKLRSDQP